MYFLDDLFHISAIYQAFNTICLNKMLSDGYFDMSIYINGRLKKDDIKRQLISLKSPYAALYEGPFPQRKQRLRYGF